MVNDSQLTDVVTKQKLHKYFALTQEALKKVKLRTQAQINVAEAAADFLDMAQRYYDDAHFFEKKGDIVTAFASVSYAHGWLDAGARIGLFDVDGDNRLFTVDEQ